MGEDNCSQTLTRITRFGDMCGRCLPFLVYCWNMYTPLYSVGLSAARKGVAGHHLERCARHEALHFLSPQLLENLFSSTCCYLGYDLDHLMSRLDRAVCKLVVASGSIEATGFLASCRTTCGSISFIVTNNHVLPSETDVSGTMVEFHGLIIHGGDEEVVTLCLPPVRPCSSSSSSSGSGSRGTTDDTPPASLFHTSIALDATVVGIRDHTLKRLAAHGIVPIPLRRPTPLLRRGNAITLIHHPRGGPRTRSTDRVRGFGEGGKLKV